MNRPLEIAINAYREAASSGVTAISECEEAACQAVKDAVVSGALGVSPDWIVASWCEELARRAHREITKSGKDMVTRYGRGGVLLKELIDEAIVPLGEGAVIQVKEAGAEALIMMDRERYENLREVQNGYDDWRTDGLFRHFVVLQRTGLTIGEAFDQGLLT